MTLQKRVYPLMLHKYYLITPSQKKLWIFEIRWRFDAFLGAFLQSVEFTNSKKSTGFIVKKRFGTHFRRVIKLVLEMLCSKYE